MMWNRFVPTYGNSDLGLCPFHSLDYMRQGWVSNMPILILILILFLILVLSILIILLVHLKTRKEQIRSDSREALFLLDTRLANGEISIEE